MVSYQFTLVGIVKKFKELLNSITGEYDINHSCFYALITSKDYLLHKIQFIPLMYIEAAVLSNIIDIEIK